jgi:hypothetical protein
MTATVLVLVAGLLCGLGAVTPAFAKPPWVAKRPVSAEYFIGIGTASIASGRGDYRQVAKSVALSDLASEIAVTVVSDNVLETLEIGDSLAQEYRQHVRMSTAQKLEGYEVADDWEGDGAYWIYCRLSKQVYEDQRRAARQKAEALALDHYSRALAAQADGDHGRALRSLLQSVRAVEEYLGETTRVRYEGSEVYLTNEIYAALDHLLADLKLETRPANLEVQHSRVLQRDFTVRAVYAGSASPAVSVADLPLTFSLTKGEGELIEVAVTNAAGEARGTIIRLASRESLQLVTVRVDLAQLAGCAEGSSTYRTLFSRLSVPETRLVLNVTGARILVEVAESNLGQPLGVPIVEPLFKKELATRGFSFVDSPADADYLIRIKAGTREGGKIGATMYSSFAEIAVSLVDLATGEELHQDIVAEKKGIQLSFDKAGVAALEAAAKEATGTVVAEIYKAISR